jgi:hypothetical protein
MRHLPIRPMTSRLLTAAGAVAAACAISSTACAATYTPAARTSAASSTCAGATNLRLRIADSQVRATGGITYYTLNFTNTSGSACSLSGYPYVSLISRGGRQLGSPAGHGLMTIVPRVVLAPGATAHTTLAYHSGLVSNERGCGSVVKAYELRVYVAGQKRALYAAMGLRACSDTGHVYLTITQSFRA